MGEPFENIIPWTWPAAGGKDGGGPGGPGGPGGRGGGRGPRRPGMHVVALASQKEGSGKTTLAAHLAVQVELCGAGPVAIVDTDPQGGLADWWHERKAEFPAFAHTFASRIGEDLDRLQNLGIKACVIDTPPAISETVEPVVEQADLVVIPCRPTAHDLRAAGATVELVERLQTHLVFVINAATPRARITAEAAIALSQHGTLAPVTVHDRADFTAAMETGQTVMETDAKSESAAEIAQLWAYFAGRLRLLTE